MNGAVIVGENSGAMGRISGTPIMTNESWSTNSASGTLTLTTVSGTFQNGENLLVNGVTRARVSGAIGAKTNYIRAYYGDESSHGTQNSIPTDSNNRGGNPRIVSGSSNVVHWPVDNMSDWQEYYDYMTLVEWTEINTAIVTNPPEKLLEKIKINDTPETFGTFYTIIRDSSLLTPNSGTIDYSGIALHATGDSAAFTYFDDFAIQY